MTNKTVGERIEQKDVGRQSTEGKRLRTGRARTQGFPRSVGSMTHPLRYLVMRPWVNAIANGFWFVMFLALIWVV